MSHTSSILHGSVCCYEAILSGSLKIFLILPHQVPHFKQGVVYNKMTVTQN